MSIFSNGKMVGKMIIQSGRNHIFLRRSISTTSVIWQQKSPPDGQNRLQQMIVKSYVRYMNYYESMLEKRFPAAMKVYKVFKNGIQTFFLDLKSFMNVRLAVAKLNKEKGFHSLTRKEIELYDQMPKDMLKIAPVLLLSALPFANYVVFPIAYMYPKRLLTSHFWTDEQKREFRNSYLSERLKNNSPLMKSLQYHTKDIKDAKVIPKWTGVMQLLQGGRQPSVQQLIECRHLFVTGPYSIANLHFAHRRHLLRLHGLSMGFNPTGKLYKRAFLLKEIDKAILREGGVVKMKDEEIKNACFLRGFSTAQLSDEDIINLLEKYIMLSKTVTKESFSFLLHSPVLLGYNLPHYLPKNT